MKFIIYILSIILIVIGINIILNAGLEKKDDYEIKLSKEPMGFYKSTPKEIFSINPEEEIKKAKQAKADYADYLIRLKAKEEFCGKGNVDEEFGSAFGYASRSLPCKDYRLVPDKNLK